MMSLRTTYCAVCDIAHIKNDSYVIVAAKFLGKKENYIVIVGHDDRFAASQLEHQTNKYANQEMKPHICCKRFE